MSFTELSEQEIIRRNSLKELDKLKGSQAHSSVLLSEFDLKTFKKLGIDVTEEPVSYAIRLYVK